LIPQLQNVYGSLEDLSLKDLIIGLLGPEGRRRLQLRQLPNDQVFSLYDSDLVLRIRNEKNLKSIRQFLAHFKAFLNDQPPSEARAKAFLALYKNRKPHTWYNYVGEIKRFMAWYDEPPKLKAKLPVTLPIYHEDNDIEALFNAARAKKTHKKKIPRDELLIELAVKSGLRRSELSNLTAGDVHPNFLMVRQGKNRKDRFIPLAPSIAEKLHVFIKNMGPNEKIFKLNPTSLGMKIKDLAKRAGLTDLHCHSLRHKYATDLLEHGADIRSVQRLMGHQSINTTSVYLGSTDKRLTEAANLLEKPSTETKPDGWADYRDAWPERYAPQPAQPKPQRNYVVNLAT
jgi:site-specific recombinase XerD